MSDEIDGVCENCGQGLHYSVEGRDEGEPGRMACDGCNKPTVDCTCTPA